MERPGPLAAHSATDVITQEIREALKELDDESLVVDTETFEQYRHPGKKKVVVVKEIMGQGAMHDNLLLPVEPVGVLGAKPNVDIGNVPVVVSPSFHRTISFDQSTSPSITSKVISSTYRYRNMYSMLDAS